MAAPEVDVPVYEYLATLDPQRFLPGVGDIPEDVITLLETNPRFIEGLLVGLNHEMSRELPLARFPSGAAQHDVSPVLGIGRRRARHHADPRLGSAQRPRRQVPAAAPAGQIALLVRGRLLRRYPNATVYACARPPPTGRSINPPARADLMLPVFAGVLGDDIAFVGFDLTEPQLDSGRRLVLRHPGAPDRARFGFDEGHGAQPALSSSSDATWAHVGTAAGERLKIAGNALAGVTFDGATFVEHAAHLASITLQKPFRVAVHARSLVDHG